MLMKFTPLDVAILLGAELMYSMVPFVRATKGSRSESEDNLMTSLKERLRQAGKAKRSNEEFEFNSYSSLLEFEMDDCERAACVYVLTQCQSECERDPIDRELHLRTRDNEDVRRLIKTIESPSRKRQSEN
ncbi:MAG: hypothetical protein N2C14_06890 [Planctomycetales bacterium]